MGGEEKESMFPRRGGEVLIRAFCSIPKELLRGTNCQRMAVRTLEGAP